MPDLHWYQLQDSITMARRPATLLAYEAGVGKTAASIAMASRHAPDGPWWISTKQNALDQWKKNLETWAPGFTNYTLCHHEAAGNFVRTGSNARVVILDESDVAKNVDTEIFKIFYTVCRSRSPYGSKRIACLTATPLRNGVIDLIAQLLLMGTFSWDQYNDLVMHYCDPKFEGFNGRIDARGASNLAELASVLQNVMIRRTYPSAGVRMPPPIFCTAWARDEDNTAGQAYRHAAEDFSTWYKSSRGEAAPPLARFVTLRRMLELSKVSAVAAGLKEDLAAGAQVLSFCEFRETAKALHSQFRGSGLVMGGDSAGDRAETVERIVAGEPGLTIATTGALDSALDMQAVDRVNYASLGWDPSTFAQTGGRAWRQGRRAPVYMRRFCRRDDPLEKYIETVLLRKEEVLKSLNLLPTLNMGALLNS